MIFTPENVKRLGNVSIIWYKGKTRVYEVGVVPNKLYEYKKNKQMPLEEVLLTPKVFTDLSKGELAKKEEVLQELKCRSEEEALRFILDHGTEKKDRATREYEHENMKKAIAEGLQRRLRSSDKKSLTPDEALQVLKQLGYTPNTKPPKIQMADVIKRALRLGYTRRTIKMAASKDIDWSSVTAHLPEGSTFQMIGQVIEATDDLYGPMHRLAEEHSVQLEDLPEEEEAQDIEI